MTTLDAGPIAVLEPQEKGAGTPPDAPRSGAPGGASPLPCQNRNNSTKDGYKSTPCAGNESFSQSPDGRVWQENEHGVLKGFELSGPERKSAFQLRGNLDSFVEVWGHKHCAFWTLTDLEGITPRQFARRWNSLIAHHGEWIRAFVRVLEPQGNGNPHYHLIVSVPWDMQPERFDWEAFLGAAKQPGESRTSFRERQRTPDWRALRKRYVESSAPETVALWKRLRTHLVAYGLGRSEFVPVRKVGAITEYVGAYLEAGIKIRIHGWKGARRVETDRRTSHLWKTHGRQFSWISPGARSWRKRVGEIAAMIGVNSLDGIKENLGSRWAYWVRGYVTASDDEWREMLPHLIAWLADRHRRNSRT